MTKFNPRKNIMTKEELKAKLISDPEARKKFIAATTEYYKSIGLTADHKDLAELSKNLSTTKVGGIRVTIFPIIFVIPVERE